MMNFAKYSALAALMASSAAGVPDGAARKLLASNVAEYRFKPCHAESCDPCQNLQKKQCKELQQCEYNVGPDHNAHHDTLILDRTGCKSISARQRAENGIKESDPSESTIHKAMQAMSCGEFYDRGECKTASQLGVNGGSCHWNKCQGVCLESVQEAGACDRLQCNADGFCLPPIPETFLNNAAGNLKDYDSCEQIGLATIGSLEECLSAGQSIQVDMPPGWASQVDDATDEKMAKVAAWETSDISDLTGDPGVFPGCSMLYADKTMGMETNTPDGNVDKTWFAAYVAEGLYFADASSDSHPLPDKNFHNGIMGMATYGICKLRN